MAASSSCNSIGAPIDKLVVHQGASTAPEGSLHVGLLNVDCMKAIKRTDDHGGHLISNNRQASRFATIAVAATAWAGLSMCPVEAFAMAYDGDHRNVGESLFNTSSTSMLQLSGYVNIPGDFETMGEIYEEDVLHIFNAEMEATVGNVPSIKPPNAGLNSPWVPKINGLKKKDANKTMRCPKWTESELEMVLPDFQGQPKPFPRNQGHINPFWPATGGLMNNKGRDDNYENLIQDKFLQSRDESSLLVIKSAASTQNEGAKDTHDGKTLPSSPAPPPQQMPIMPIKKSSCFTM